MKASPRKLVTIVTEAAIEKELLAALEGLGVSGYTVSDARGKGHRGVRSSSWAFGANVRVEVVCDEATAGSVVDYLREHYYNDYAMILFVGDVEVLRPEKF